MKKTCSIVILLITFSRIGFTQNAELDSLNNLMKHAMSDSLKGYVLDELSYVWYYDNLDSSLTYALRSIETFQAIALHKGTAHAYTSAAVAYHYKNDWDSAEANYKRAMETNQILEDEKEIAGNLNNLGVLYMDKGDYEKAANHFLTSLKIKEALDDSAGMASGNANLGLIFRKQGNYENAILYYSKSLAILTQLGMTKKLPIVYLNMGSLYNYKREFKKGNEYNQMALDISLEINSTRFIGESYVNISDSFLGLGEMDSSLLYVKNAITIFRNNTDTINLCKSLISAASLHLQREEYQIAVAYSREVAALKKDRNYDLDVKNSFALSQGYAGLRRMDKAYEALLSAYSAKDSLLSESLNETITNLTTKFESEKKERKIIALERDMIEADLNLTISKNQRNILLLVAGLTLGFSILLIRLYKIKSMAEERVAKSLTEKETLLKEIHHRVKNNLQIVSSLLSMQSRFIKDKKALGAVNEGQSRVQSMALIHQKLYQENNLSGVNANEYIEDLTELLKESYSTDTDVAFKYEIGNLTIDVDTIIPIGLILNELICNALKHAFPDKPEGKVLIRLKEEDSKLVLEVSDNGVGYEERSSIESFGTVLIESLATKLKAELQINSDRGTSTVLYISKYKLV